MSAAIASMPRFDSWSASFLAACWRSHGGQPVATIAESLMFVQLSSWLGACT
jgi:hypothetical protein